MKVKGVLNAATIEANAEDVKQAPDACRGSGSADRGGRQGTLARHGAGHARAFAEHREQRAEVSANRPQTTGEPRLQGCFRCRTVSIARDLASLQLDVSANELSRKDESGVKGAEEIADAARTI